MKKLSNLIALLLLSNVLVVANVCFADDSPAEFSESDLSTTDMKQYKKFNVKFDDELVKGGKETPNTEFIFQKSDFNFKKLIRLRENFIPEVQKGKDDMRGVK